MQNASKKGEQPKEVRELSEDRRYVKMCDINKPHESSKLQMHCHVRRLH